MATAGLPVVTGGNGRLCCIGFAAICFGGRQKKKKNGGSDGTRTRNTQIDSLVL